MIIYRIQDSDGRGPFKPGFSHHWADIELIRNMPTWMEEFGSDLILRKGRQNEHFGTGVRTIPEISKWFSITEQKRLDLLGYKICAVRISRVLAESSNQLVFASKSPLKDSLCVPWTWDDS
jgi:hypothetical protein